MSLMRSNAYHFILLSAFAVIFGYVIGSPLSDKWDLKKYSNYQDSLLNFTQLTTKYGYVSEEHRVVTEDGYILTMFRMASRECRGKKRSPPILLMHGLLLSSDCFLDSGPGAGLAYLISDGCYDLWVGNSRGNYYSRRHLTLDPDKDKDYWQFEILETGKYDLPAMIDYVLNYTRSKKLNYIGYSQGSGVFLVMCSERPEYCDKVQLLIGLAPASRLLHIQSAINRSIVLFFAKFETYLSKYGVTEMFARGSRNIISFLCQASDVTLEICKVIMYLDSIGDSDLESRTLATTRTLLGHFPAGTSLHNLAWYGQSVTSKHFKKFDYGKEKNIKVYGSEIPPEYNLTSVTAPFVCIYGKNDGLADTKDVKWLMSQLPNVLEGMEVKNPFWTHLDMIYSRYTSKAIMPKINEYLSKYSWVDTDLHGQEGHGSVI